MGGLRKQGTPKIVPQNSRIPLYSKDAKKAPLNSEISSNISVVEGACSEGLTYSARNVLPGKDALGAIYRKGAGGLRGSGVFENHGDLEQPHAVNLRNLNLNPKP